MSFPPAWLAFVLLALASSLRAAPETDGYQSLVQAATTASNLDQPGLIDRATALRAEADELDEVHARIAVHRDVAVAFAQREAWADASAQLDQALNLARSLGNPDLLISLYLETADNYHCSGNQITARQRLDSADVMITRLGRPKAWFESQLLRAASLAEDGRNEPRAQAESIYESLLVAPDADRFRIELERARHTRIDLKETFTTRWTRVLESARARPDPAVEAEACDQLGMVAYSGRDYPQAARYFAQAEDIATPQRRNAAVWLGVVDTYNRMDDRPRAHRALAAAAELITDGNNPGAAADLHEAKGHLLGRAGDFEGAYQELKLAMELRRRRDATRQSLPLTRVTPMVNARNVETAAELAAVRNALREAELERTQLRARQTAGVATVAVLTTALLGLAYAYKRRSVAALATARDNAELRADRIRWQMLRYQLNPHFLFNALSSLSGMVSHTSAAGRIVDRLSEFCQLALQGSRDEMRRLDDELQLIRAYLDVEQAGAGDTLKTGFEIDPAAKGFLIPPLLLQPLVENALKYGALTSPELLEIQVKANLSEQGRTLRLEVANSGTWVEPSLAHRGRDAIGLTNIRERLALLKLDASCLTIITTGGWVRIVLQLPQLPALPVGRHP